MEMHSSPPPLPPSGKRRAWPLVVAVIAFVVVGALVLGAAAVFTYRRLEAKKAAVAQLETAAADERAKMADIIESGAVTGGDAALGRLKAQLEKSATQFGSGDAGAARAMAAFLGKMQEQVRGYESVVARLTAAEVFSFRLRDKATLEAHRQLVRDFLETNTRLAATLTQSNEMVRTEMDAAKVPARAADATMAGFEKSQEPLRALQMRIRACDQTLGEAALAIFAQLEKEWGKWTFDEAAGQLRFNDDATLERHNAFIEKIQTASTEQAAAQAELVAKMRGAKTP